MPLLSHKNKLEQKRIKPHWQGCENVTQNFIYKLHISVAEFNIQLL